jgi:hypothetical protein
VIPGTRVDSGANQTQNVGEAEIRVAMSSVFHLLTCRAFNAGQRVPRAFMRIWLHRSHRPRRPGRGENGAGPRCVPRTWTATREPNAYLAQRLPNGVDMAVTKASKKAHVPSQKRDGEGLRYSAAGSLGHHPYSTSANYKQTLPAQKMRP